MVWAARSMVRAVSKYFLLSISPPQSRFERHNAVELQPITERRTGPLHRRSSVPYICLRRGYLDSSLRDVKQNDSNKEVGPSRGGEQIDDVLDGLVGAVVGGFESAVRAILRVRTAVEAAVGKGSAQPFVEEQK